MARKTPRMTPLHALLAGLDETGAAACRTRLALLRQLARTPCRSAADVAQLHTALCRLRAYPGDARVLAQVERMLAGFERRPDLRRHRDALADSGIAGTAIRDRFFGGQAQWLVRNWPARLHLDRSDKDAHARIAAALPQLLTPAEADALIELAPQSGYATLDRLRGRRTDAAFLLERIGALRAPSLVRESLSDGIDASYVLQPARGTPSQTAAYVAAAPMARNLGAGPQRGRPELRVELARAPRRLSRLKVADGEALADAAQSAMATRARSLEAFSYADARDAWLADDGDGLAFGFLGMQPERRHVLTTSYGSLTLRNRVPIGYAQADIAGRSAALSFNTFDAFRGAEAAFTFARWLAALHHLFATTSFTIEPYQLGLGNDEGLASGAWWFYFKLGFRPRDPETAALADAEVARLRRRPGTRTSPRTLLRLAASHLFFDLDPAHPCPLPQPAALGLSAGARLSRQAGSRDAAQQHCAEALLGLCGLAGWQGFSRDEREAWRRLAPTLSLLGIERWRPDERRALVDVIRSKGWRSERDHVALAISHPRLEAALLRAGARAAAAQR